MDLLVSCKCGHQMTVSEYAAGMTAPCPKCGQPLTVSPENAKPIARESAPAATRPTPAPSTSAPDIHYTPLQTSSLKNNCARCGREFRGDWDRHQSAIGLVCNICKNLVQQNQNLQSTGYIAPVDSMKLDPVIDPQPKDLPEVEEVEKTWREKYWPDEAMMRRIAIGGAVAFGLYTVYLLISGAWEVGPAPEDLQNSGAIAENAQIPELPAWARLAMKAMGTSSGFVSAFAGIYIFLTLSQRLPEKNFLANAIQLLPATAIVTALYFAASVFGGFIGHPYILMFMVSVTFVPVVVFANFGLEAQDVINYPIGMGLGAVLQYLFYLLILWLIGSIAL